ncbi:MAG: T9SS type A sorting domain-containing protein [Bacteroidales bacterium]
MKSVYILFLILLLLGRSYAQNSPQLIVNDMTLAPDAALHGVPVHYSWASGAANAGGPVPATNNQGDWFRAMTSWGQVYIPVEGSQASNTRCQIRNMVSRFLTKNGLWVTVQNNNPQGAAFVEDFANNASINAGIRNESNNGGGISVIVGVGQWTSYNFHFWPQGSRAEVDVDSVIGVFTSCEARLIVNDADLPDDRDLCKNILQMGADWWLNLTIGWLPDWSANSGIGNGRSKWLTKEWQSFNFCTLSAAEILMNPPVSMASVDKIEAHMINIRPNPAKGMISFDLAALPESKNLSATICDMQGNILLQQSISQENNRLNISRLTKGIYIVIIGNDEQSLYGRLVKE